MKRNRVIMSMLGLVFALNGVTVTAHPFLGDITAPREEGGQQVQKIVKAKLLAKLLKRAMFKVKVAELVKGRASACFETFTEKLRERIVEVIANVKQKAEAEGITIGEFTPDPGQQTKLEQKIEQRQEKFLAEIKGLKGLALERAVLRWMIKSCERMKVIHEEVASHVGANLRQTLEEQVAKLKELKEEAQRLLGNE